MNAVVRCREKRLKLVSSRMQSVMEVAELARNVNVADPIIVLADPKDVVGAMFRSGGIVATANHRSWDRNGRAFVDGFERAEVMRRCSTLVSREVEMGLSMTPSGLLCIAFGGATLMPTVESVAVALGGKP